MLYCTVRILRFNNLLANLHISCRCLNRRGWAQLNNNTASEQVNTKCFTQSSQSYSSLVVRPEREICKVRNLWIYSVFKNVYFYAWGPLLVGQGALPPPPIYKHYSIMRLSHLNFWSNIYSSDSMGTNKKRSPQHKFLRAERIRIVNRKIFNSSLNFS